MSTTITMPNGEVRRKLTWTTGKRKCKSRKRKVKWVVIKRAKGS